MWEKMRSGRMAHWEAQAYASLPRPDMLPRKAFQKLMAGQAELLPLDKMANRVVGVGVIPYPPGIPIVMPGENIGPADGPWISFLRALLEWGRAFPGFAKEVEGTIEKDESYWVYCLKK
jgi:arginine decarboxylase